MFIGSANVNERTVEQQNAYTRFLDEFNRIIDDVNRLDSNIKSQWGSKLSMAYHWKKHKGDFGPEISVENYFGEQANRIFQDINKTSSYHSQMGDIKNNYAKKFGNRLHIGFTFGSNQIKASHFTKGVR